jgi:hypothetical protein
MLAEPLLLIPALYVLDARRCLVPAGGHLPVLFANTYHQFTINEWLPVSATLTAVDA